MQTRIFGLIRMGLVGVLLLALLAGVSVPPPTTALAAAPAATAGAYLALGDSAAFGYNPVASTWISSNFSGYAELAAQSLNLTGYNASCPGDTTQHFLGVPNAPDLSCGLYHFLYPLHVWYLGSQMDYVNVYMWLGGASTTKLVTLQLGINNYLLLVAVCFGNRSCIAAGLPSISAQVTTDLKTIVNRVRADGYGGKLLLVNFYPTTAASDPYASDVQVVNAAISAAATQTGVRVVDVFTAFKNGAPGGNPCAVGLLWTTANGTCDVHPSAKGHALIASLIADAARTAGP